MSSGQTKRYARDSQLIRIPQSSDGLDTLIEVPRQVYFLPDLQLARYQFIHVRHVIQLLPATQGRYSGSSKSAKPICGSEE